jgi:hypothetical protein
LIVINMIKACQHTFIHEFPSVTSFAEAEPDDICVRRVASGRSYDISLSGPKRVWVRNSVPSRIALCRTPVRVKGSPRPVYMRNRCGSLKESEARVDKLAQAMERCVWKKHAHCHKWKVPADGTLGRGNHV